MEIGMYALIAILGLGFLALVGYDIRTKAKLHIAKIQLERDQIALEQKKLEFGKKNV